MKTYFFTKWANVWLILLLIVVSQSCRKDEPLTELETPETLIERSKRFFEDEIKFSIDKSETTISRTETNLRQLISKVPLWQESYVKQLTIGNVVIIPLSYGATIYTKAGRQKQALSINNLSYLLMYPATDGGMNAELVTWIPDDDWWDVGRKELRPFVGRVIVEDWAGNFLKGFLYDANGSVTPVTSEKRSIKGAGISREDCISTDWYTCWNGYGESGCRYDYTETLCTPGSGGESNGGSAGSGFGSGSGREGSGGRGKGSSPPPQDYIPDTPYGNCPPGYKPQSLSTSKIPSGCEPQFEPIELPKEFTHEELINAAVIDDARLKISDIRKYTKCFDNGQTGLEYHLILYVDQPIPGKADHHLIIATPIVTLPPQNGVKLLIESTTVDVGHTFLGFEKVNADGTITRQVLGFYPDGAVENSKGVIKDDSGGHYDVSLSSPVSETQFNLALTQMIYDFDHAIYNLTNILGQEYNCSDAAIRWFNYSGITLPNSSQSNFYTNTPGELGQALRSNSSVNQSPGNAPYGSGNCD